MKKIIMLTTVPMLLLTLTSCGDKGPLTILEKKLDGIKAEDSSLPKAEKMAIVRNPIGYSVLHKYIDGNNTCYIYDIAISCVKNSP